MSRRTCNLLIALLFAPATVSGDGARPWDGIVTPIADIMQNAGLKPAATTTDD
jgi:hypothetical protein